MLNETETSSIHGLIVTDHLYIVVSLYFEHAFLSFLEPLKNQLQKHAHYASVLDYIHFETA